ncbi:MAG TPA: class I adenylate-forming enzyme family protein [Myxococcota bacterium]|nr:class I adenylate-forming enzyme family protein [Myxococcota bacterium]
MTHKYDEVVRNLTGPGAPFEVVTETVRGRAMKTFKNRERSLREKVAAAAARGDLPFLVQGERRFSYGEFARCVFGAARALARDHGLAKGDRVAILSYNCPDWIIALFGATSAGGIGVGLNGWWAAEELEYGLVDSGSRYLVVDERLFPRVAPLLGRIPGLETVFYIGDHAPTGTVPIAELLAPNDAPPTTPIDEDDPFAILYTSGTTGRSKGCITTHRGTIAQVTGILFANLVNAAVSGAALLPPSGAQPASLFTSPLFHVGGLHSIVCTQMTIGAKLVFNRGRFDPEEVLQLIQDEKISIWGAIPTMLHRVVHHPKIRDYDLGSLRGISFGGAPTPPETIERAREVLPTSPSFANAYGLTETHGVAIVNGGMDVLERKTSIGRPLPILDVKIVDAEGKELPEGQLGELLIYGPTITPGYWNRPDATAETVRDGWLHTGDLGYRDADGYYFVVDRAKDMILRGGENVYCTEIENCLADHPEIDEAAVIGVPDAEFGERVKAIVRRVPGSALGEAAVRAHVAAHLASFKVPEFVEFTDEALPRNPAGKLLKNALRGGGAVPFDTSGGA